MERTAWKDSHLFKTTMTNKDKIQIAGDFQRAILGNQQALTGGSPEAFAVGYYTGFLMRYMDDRLAIEIKRRIKELKNETINQP